MIFCDLSTPKADGTFNVYDDVREKLVAKGIPREEIAFIHEANTETKKAELFAKVRSGQVRILLGSTPKLGAGTNIQDRLIALHHLDCPWKPSDLEQQEGRILRQGNRNQKVKIFRYVTENTFNSYMWQILENKQNNYVRWRNFLLEVPFFVPERRTMSMKLMKVDFIRFCRDGIFI